MGFRWFVEREANVIGMRGWVRNNEDATVELIAQGTEDQHAALRSRLKEGPRGSRVDQVDESPIEIDQHNLIAELKRFEIQGAW